MPYSCMAIVQRQAMLLRLALFSRQAGKYSITALHLPILKTRNTFAIIMASRCCAKITTAR